MDSLYPGRSFCMEDQKIKWIIGILIGTAIGIVIGFSVYHYFLWTNLVVVEYTVKKKAYNLCNYLKISL